VSGKPAVLREAVAEGVIKLRRETLRLVREGRVAKGDVLEAARLAAIMACKETPRLIPLCHQIPLTHVSVEFDVGEDEIRARVRVRAKAETGVEMEALTGVTVALLTVWDMVKQYEKDAEGGYPCTEIGGVRVVRKIKGRCDG